MPLRENPFYEFSNNFENFLIFTSSNENKLPSIINILILLSRENFEHVLENVDFYFFFPSLNKMQFEVQSNVASSCVGEKINNRRQQMKSLLLAT